MILIVLAIMGPVAMLIASGSPNDPSYGFFMTAGGIITAIDVILIIVAIVKAIQKKKNPQKQEKRQAPEKQMSQAELDELYKKALYGKTGVPKSERPASVTKRTVAGTIIGGVPGAIIGAASAIDKNNKNNNKK